MNKIIGYILALIGIAGVAVYAIPQLGKLVPLPPQISGQILLIVSIIVAVAGIFIVLKGGKGKVREVPIYAGKDVVGFRRIGKR